MEHRDAEMPTRAPLGRDMPPEEREQARIVMQQAVTEFNRTAAPAATGTRCPRCGDPAAALAAVDYQRNEACADCFVALRLDAWRCQTCRMIKSGQPGFCSRHRLGGAEGEHPTPSPEAIRALNEAQAQERREREARNAEAMARAQAESAALAVCAFGCGATKDELLSAGHRAGCRGVEIEEENERRARAAAGVDQGDGTPPAAPDPLGPNAALAVLKARDRMLGFTTDTASFIEIIDIVQAAEKADRLGRRMMDRARERPRAGAPRAQDLGLEQTKRRATNHVHRLFALMPEGEARVLLGELLHWIDPNALPPPVMVDNRTEDEKHDQAKRYAEDALRALPDGVALQLDNTYGAILRILVEHVGEAGDSEGAVDVVRRIIGERDQVRLDLATVDAREQAALDALWTIAGRDVPLKDGENVMDAALNRLPEIVLAALHDFVAWVPTQDGEQSRVGIDLLTRWAQARELPVTDRWWLRDWAEKMPRQRRRARFKAIAEVSPPGLKCATCDKSDSLFDPDRRCEACYVDDKPLPSKPSTDDDIPF